MVLGFKPVPFLPYYAISLKKQNTQRTTVASGKHKDFSSAMLIQNNNISALIISVSVFSLMATSLEISSNKNLMQIWEVRVGALCSVQDPTYSSDVKIYPIDTFLDFCISA